MVALFTLGGVTVSAKKVYADLSKLGNGPVSTWDGTTQSITWTKQSNNMISNFDFAAGDYRSYDKIVVSVSDLNNAIGVRVQIRANGQEKTVALNGEGTFEKALTTDFGFTTADLQNLEWIRLLGSGFYDGESHTINADNPASAKIVYVYLSKPTTLDFDAFGKAKIDKSDLTATGGLTYNPSTGALSSDGTAGSLVLEFATPVDMKNLFQFNVTQSGSTNDILSRLEFYDEDNTIINTWNSIKLGNTWNASGIDNNATNAFLNHKPVKKMVWPSDANASNNGKTATITSVEFTCKTISCAKAGETQLNTLAYKKMNGDPTSPSWNMNTSTSLYYGSTTGDAAVSYADVTAYSEIRIYRDDNTGFRAFFINSGGTNVNNIDNNNEASSWNAEGKYWSIDLSKVDKYGEIVALQGIKSELSWVPNAVKNIVVYNTPVVNAPKYILTGSGFQLAETVAALADETATCIDATGVTGITTDSEKGRTLLTSANPNCLFLGTTGNGGLANTQNVITSGTCANLVLTDNHPFKAPADFTATSASYTTTINATAQAGTLCLPFAATIPEGVTAYTLAYTSGNEATATPVEGTIPANTPVLLNGSGAASFTGSNVAVAADATNAADAMTGVFEATGVPTGSYVLQMDESNKVGFYKVDASDPITAQPFRAYLTAASGAGAALRIVYQGDVTGIEAVETTADSKEDAFYTLSGVRVSHPVKGLYIKNGKKVMVK